MWATTTNFILNSEKLERAGISEWIKINTSINKILQCNIVKCTLKINKRLKPPQPPFERKWFSLTAPGGLHWARILYISYNMIFFCDTLISQILRFPKNREIREWRTASVANITWHESKLRTLCYCLIKHLVQPLRALYFWRYWTFAKVKGRFK